MASVTRRESAGRVGYRIRFYCDKRQRELYLPGAGKSAERLAKRVAGFCESLAQSKASNISPDPEAQKWANGTEGGLRDKLVTWGLADPISPKLATDAGRLLGPFLDSYIAGRTDVGHSTRTNYLAVRKLLCEYFGERHPLRAITVADSERWKRWMLARVLSEATETTPARTMAPATVAKCVKRARTMLNDAVQDRLLMENPFTGVKPGKETNPERQRFIDAAMSARVLEACPDADWRLIFSLARWGGMRCPSEVLALKWSDVDWDKGQLRIESPKTGLRFCPMFPEVRQALTEAFDIAPEGAEHCVTRYRGSRNLRTQFNRILERAGIVPWIKPFQNLRSTRRTELQERFADHAINKWLGQSSRVAEGHYLQTTDEHWAMAIGSLTGSLVDDGHEPAASSTDTKKPRENGAGDGQRRLVNERLAPPAGREQVGKTRGKSHMGDNVPSLGPLSGAVRGESDVDELVSIWGELDEASRGELLAVARSICRQQATV